MKQIKDVIRPQNLTWFLGSRSAAFAVSIDFPDSSALAVEGMLLSGTIWPSNDGDAKGIIFDDQELGKAGALVVSGTVAANMLPEYPDAAAIAALKNIMFLDKAEVL